MQQLEYNVSNFIAFFRLYENRLMEISFFGSQVSLSFPRSRLSFPFRTI